MKFGERTKWTREGKKLNGGGKSIQLELPDLRQILLGLCLVSLSSITACSGSGSSQESSSSSSSSQESSPSQEGRVLQPKMQFYINQLSQEELSIAQSMLPAINTVEHIAQDRNNCIGIVNPVSGATGCFQVVPSIWKCFKSPEGVYDVGRTYQEQELCSLVALAGRKYDMGIGSLKYEENQQRLFVAYNGVPGAQQSGYTHRTKTSTEYGADAMKVLKSSKTSPTDSGSGSQSQVGGSSGGSGGDNKPSTKTITKIYGCPGEENPIKDARYSGWTGKECQ